MHICKIPDLDKKIQIIRSCVSKKENNIFVSFQRIGHILEPEKNNTDNIRRQKSYQHVYFLSDIFLDNNKISCHYHARIMICTEKGEIGYRTLLSTMEANK